jgi:hypothetical protein
LNGVQYQIGHGDVVFCGVLLKKQFVLFLQSNVDDFVSGFGNANKSANAFDAAFFLFGQLRFDGNIWFHCHGIP